MLQTPALHPAQWPVISACSSRFFLTPTPTPHLLYHLHFAGADGAVNCSKMATVKGQYDW